MTKTIILACVAILIVAAVLAGATWLISKSIVATAFTAVVAVVVLGAAAVAIGTAINIQ